MQLRVRLDRQLRNVCLIFRVLRLVAEPGPAPPPGPSGYLQKPIGPQQRTGHTQATPVTCSVDLTGPLSPLPNPLCSFLNLLSRPLKHPSRTSGYHRGVHHRCRHIECAAHAVVGQVAGAGCDSGVGLRVGLWVYCRDGSLWQICNYQYYGPILPIQAYYQIPRTDVNNCLSPYWEKAALFLLRRGLSLYVYIYIYKFTYVFICLFIYMSVESYIYTCRAQINVSLSGDCLYVCVCVRVRLRRSIAGKPQSLLLCDVPSNVGNGAFYSAQHGLLAPALELAAQSLDFGSELSFNHMVGCENYGPLLGPLNTRCRITLGTQPKL